MGQQFNDSQRGFNPRIVLCSEVLKVTYEPYMDFCSSISDLVKFAKITEFQIERMEGAIY